MYQAGEKIVYGSVGVCTVEDVGTGFVRGDKRPYYKLRPVYSTETIYIPVDSDVFMRPVLTREEAEELIARLPNIDGEICSDSNLTALRQQYDAFFQSHACEDYFRLVKGVYSKGKQSKKLGQTDQRYMKRAEDVLYGELAVALDIPADQVVSYIKKSVENAPRIV